MKKTSAPNETIPIIHAIVVPRMNSSTTNVIGEKPQKKVEGYDVFSISDYLTAMKIQLQLHYCITLILAVDVIMEEHYSLINLQLFISLL